MKKFLKAMLAAMLIAITAVTVCSCGVPSDPAKAKENLESNEYVVEKVDGSLATLSAKALALLANVTLKDGADSIVSGTNLQEAVTIIYFKDSKDASAMKKVGKDLVEKYKEENGDDSDVEYIFGASGKLFYMGTKAGIEAAKKAKK